MIQKQITFLSLLIAINPNLYSMEQEFGVKSDEQLKIMAYINPKRLLGLKENDTARQAKIAYYNLALKYHPDKSELNNSIFTNITLAYNNILGEKIKYVDKYIIIKKLLEICKKKEAERSIFDLYLLAILKANGISTAQMIDLKNYDNIEQFLNKHEHILNNISKLINNIVTALNKLDQNISKTMLTDIIHSFNELYRISSLGSNDDINIKRAAKIGQFFHILSILNMPINLLDYLNIKGLCKMTDYFNIEHKATPINSSVDLARFSTILPGLSAFKFAKQDAQVRRDASKIAQYNKATKRDLKSAKLKQLAWYGINKIAPYVGFALMRKIHDKDNFSNAFNHNSIINIENRTTMQTFSVFKAISNISEIIRKHYRYKAEMGDYQNYFKNKNITTN